MGAGVTLPPPPQEALVGQGDSCSVPFLPLRSGAAASMTHGPGWAWGSAPSTCLLFFPLLPYGLGAAMAQSGKRGSWHRPAVFVLLCCLRCPERGWGDLAQLPGLSLLRLSVPTTPRPPAPAQSGPEGQKGTFFSFSDIVLTCFSLSLPTSVLSSQLRWSQTREPNSVKPGPLTPPVCPGQGFVGDAPGAGPGTF